MGAELCNQGGGRKGVCVQMEEKEREREEENLAVAILVKENRCEYFFPFLF